MNTRYLYSLLALLGFVLFIMALAIAAGGSPATAQVSPPQPINGPITSVEQAVSQALYFDSIYTRRSRPAEAVGIEPPYLTTRQAYADSIGGGSKFPDPETANQRVWVVEIRGEVLLNAPGVPEGQMYSDPTYIFSAETGELVGLTAD